MKFIFMLLILLTQLAHAQDISRDLEFVENQNSQANPFNIPLYVDLEGNLSLISRNPDASMSVGPLGQTAYKKSISNYIRPIQKNTFSFSDQKDGMGWIEVKRKRWEAGLGIGAALASNFIAVGLVPYKGARQVMIRQKKTQNEITSSPRLPAEMAEVDHWSVGDRGSFQRYGGVQLYAGAKYMLVNILTVGVTIQNSFTVAVKKISHKKVQLQICEEDLNKRRLQTGVAVANAKVHFFKGKRLTTDFTLDLTDPTHHELYRQALKGKLHLLQAKLPQSSQKMEWKGSERTGFIGIPGLAGKHSQRSEYEMGMDEEEVLDIKTRKSSGWLVPLRNHNRLVYQTDSAIILFWFSEMNKANEDVLSRKFLIPGKLMGAKGFDSMIPTGTKIGATLSQMGMSFTRQELEGVTPGMLNEILVNFKARCEQMGQDCAQESRFNKIAKVLKGYSHKKWEEMRDKLGFLMIDQPALIHAYIKTIKSQKKVYFKFLNEKYQSMEGEASIEI